MQTSDYSRATGVGMNNSSTYYGNAWWLLRSPNSFYYNYARYVGSDSIVSNDYYVYYSNYGVVPALQIRL